MEEAGRLERRFDAVAFIKVLHHLDGDSIAAAIGEAARSLPLGGRLVIFEPNGAASSGLW